MIPPTLLLLLVALAPGAAGFTFNLPVGASRPDLAPDFAFHITALSAPRFLVALTSCVGKGEGFGQSSIFTYR